MPSYDKSKSGKFQFKKPPTTPVADLDAIFHPRAYFTPRTPDIKGRMNAKQPNQNSLSDKIISDITRIRHQIVVGNSDSSNLKSGRAAKPVYGPTKWDYESAKATRQAKKQLLRAQMDAEQPGFSQDVREHVNRWTDNLTEFLTPAMSTFGLGGLLAPNLEAGLISGALMTPMQIAAEIDTLVDPKESALNKVGATGNIALQVLPFDKAATLGLQVVRTAAIERAAKGEVGPLLKFFSDALAKGVDVDRLLFPERPPMAAKSGEVGYEGLAQGKPKGQQSFIPDVSTSARNKSLTEAELKPAVPHQVDTAVDHHALAISQVNKVGKAMAKVGIDPQKIKAFSIPLYQQIRFALEHDPEGFLFGTKTAKKAPKSGLKQMEDVILRPPESGEVFRVRAQY